MYQPQLIQDAFMGLVGFRQTDNPDFPQLSAALLKNANNLLIEHSLINIENIDMTARNYSQFTYADYNAGTPYAAGDRIKTGGVVYESLVDANMGNTPATSPNDWAVINHLSLYLEDIVRSSIDQVVERVFDEKKLRRETKTLIQSVRAMDGSGSIHDLIVNQGNLVGFEITLRHRQNIIAIIEQIGLQLSAPQDNLTLYLYHSSRSDGPLTTIVIHPTGAATFQWHVPDASVALHYLTEDHNAGGAFYLMYDQNELTGQAIRTQFDWTKGPCTCNPSAFHNWQKITPYIGIRAVMIPQANRPTTGDVPDPTKMFSLSSVRITPDNNFGLNMDVTVKCDLTSFLIRQKSVFAGAIRDMVIVKLLDGMINSTRQNAVDEKVKQLARYALQDRHVGGGGLMADLNRKIKSVDFEVSALDKTCMPCNNSRGVRHTSFGLQY